MKADKKVAEKEAKIKEQLDQKKESNDQGAQNACALDEETLDPNVRFFCVDYKPESYIFITKRFYLFV